MPEGVEAPTIVTTGLGLQYSGDFAFAYSGDVTVAQNETTCLEFYTGNKNWVAHWEMHYTDNGASPVIVTDDMAWRIYMNGVIVIIMNASSSSDAKQPDVELIIPPYTLVKVTAVNVTDSSDHAVFASLTGRLYK
jgi:hypothetical protein